MRIRSLLVGLAALAVGSSESAALDLTRVAAPGCAGGAMTTCASVQVRFGQFSESAEGQLSVNLRNLRGEAALESRYQTLMASNVSANLTRPQIIAEWVDVVECRPGGRDCRVVDDPTTVTPEPVTMALLASGLVGMGGVTGIRRRLNRKQQRAE